MKSILDGLKFGMLLQLAVGPIALLIFQIAGSRGFASAMAGTAAVVLVDSLFILLAIWGIASFVGRDKVRKAFIYIGAVIIALFGLSTILGVFKVHLIPEWNIAGSMIGAGSFVEAFVLTAANPLTILFWAGVFTSRLTERKAGADRQGNTYLFGLGSALSTLIAMTIIAIIGTLTGTFLPQTAVSALNILIGGVLIFFAFRMTLKEKISRQSSAIVE